MSLEVVLLWVTVEGEFHEGYSNQIESAPVKKRSKSRDVLRNFLSYQYLCLPGGVITNFVPNPEE